ncbi:MAG: hypothetical protein JNL83_07110 [Myxococcales bacterium]|nr:hypothetical protein [Myxococcales bacterium]
MPRLASTLTALPLVVVAAGVGLVAALRPPGAAHEPPPITITVTTDPPRTVTIAEPPPPVALVPLRASTERDVPAPDLDGDGTPERFDAQPDSCGTGGCVYDVYLSTSPARRAGEIAGKWGYWTVSPRRGRPADLTTAWFLGCCTIADTTYRFARGAYREVSHETYDPRTR